MKQQIIEIKHSVYTPVQAVTQCAVVSAVPPGAVRADRALLAVASAMESMELYAFSANFQLNKGGNVRIYTAFRCVRVTVVVVEKHNHYILCVCVCVYPCLSYPADK